VEEKREESTVVLKQNAAQLERYLKRTGYNFGRDTYYPRGHFVSFLNTPT
jgi:hypothetical protein